MTKTKGKKSRGTISTIGASVQLKKKLISLKIHKNQSYEEVIWDLINGHTRPYEKKKAKK